MKNILLSLTLFIVTSCISLTNPKIEAEYRPFLSSFIKEGRIRGVRLNTDNLTIESANLKSEENPQIAGVCIVDAAYFRPRVYIDRDFWAWADEDTKEALIYHELGHCLLKRGHIELMDLISDKELSLMHPFPPTGPTYGNNRDYYVNELFRNADYTIKMSVLPVTFKDIVCLNLQDCL